MARRRRDQEPRVVFAWERRRPVLFGLDGRSFRWLLGLSFLSLFGWGIWKLEARSRAEFATRTAIGNVHRAVDAFRADHDGRCPRGINELLTPNDGHDPYLPRIPTDGWGQPLRLTCPGRRNPALAEVTSPGPSGRFEDRDQLE